MPLIVSLALGCATKYRNTAVRKSGREFFVPMLSSSIDGSLPKQMQSQWCRIDSIGVSIRRVARGAVIFPRYIGALLSAKARFSQWIETRAFSRTDAENSPHRDETGCGTLKQLRSDGFAVQRVFVHEPLKRTTVLACCLGGMRDVTVVRREKPCDESFFELNDRSRLLQPE